MMGAVSMTVAGRSRIYAWLIAALVFVAIAPTLRWMEFSGGSEDLNVGTVLEMRRGGPWIIPTLKGAPRTTKPPLTAWITAAIVRPGSVAALSDVDTDRRHQAYVELGWESRWPALLASCLLLVATYELCMTLWPGDVTFALTAMAIGGASVLFQRFARAATTDVYLALFVSVCNLLLAKACYAGKHRRIYAAAGGIALGLALMSKGPAAFAQCVAPLAMYWAWRWFESRGNPASKPRIDWTAVALATVLCLLVALPWAVYANVMRPGQLKYWYSEAIEGGGAETFKPDPWWGYISAGPLMGTWIVMFVWGLVLIVCDMIDRREDHARAALVLALAVGSIVVMSFIKQKNERYLLPMVGPMAMVAAYGLLRSPPRFAKAFRALMAGQWGLLAFAAIAGPMSFALVTKLTTLEGRQWMTIPQASLCAGLLLVVVLVGWIWDRRRSLGLQLSSLAVVLILQLLFIQSYAQSHGGASEMKPLADTIWAEAPHFKVIKSYTRPDEDHKVPIDLFIYTNTIIRPMHPGEDPRKQPASSVIVSCTDHPDTAEPIPGFRRIASMPRATDFWEAFAREN